MRKSLKVAKTQLQSDLYDTFYNAYMSQCSGSSDNSPSVNQFVKTEFKKSGEKFAEELSKNMSQAIYEFALEMQINVTTVTSIIAPSGPCTGNIPATSIKIK